MAELEELQKKFHDYRRWTADLLLKKEEEIEALSAQLTAQLEQVKKETLSARPEQGITQSVSSGNTVSLTENLNGSGIEGDACPSSEEAASSEESVPATVPYSEYAEVVQKLNLYRRNIQEKDRTLKRLNEKYQKSKAVALAWKQYAARVYEKSEKSLAAATVVPGGILPLSPIPSPATALEIGLIPADNESDISGFADISPFQRSASESRFGPKADGNRPLHTGITMDATVQTGENHPQDANALPVAANFVEDDQKDEAVGGVRIKTEPPDSPAAPNCSSGRLHRVETMDLNNVDNTADTPHRRKRMEAFLRRQQIESRAAILRRMRSNSEPFEDQLLPESTIEGADEPLPSRNLLPTLRRAGSDPMIKVEEEAYNGFISPDLDRRPEPNAETLNESTVFRPLHPNSRVLPRTDDFSTVKKRRLGDDSHGANAIHLLAEDNDVSKKKRRSERKSNGQATDFNNRLTALLHQPSPTKHRLSPNRPPSKVASGVDNEMEIDCPTGEKNSSDSGKQVCVWNIPRTTNEEELRTLFKEFHVESVSFTSNATRNPPTLAFVELSSPSEAKRAIAKFNGQTFLGREMFVQPATSTVCDSGALDTPSPTATAAKRRHDVTPLQTVRTTLTKQTERDNQSRKVVALKEQSNPNLATLGPTILATSAKPTTSDTDNQTVSKEWTEATPTFNQPSRPTSRISRQSPQQRSPSTPLRERAVSDLQLSDFKINPRANQGYEYAFVETVRSREARHQLHEGADPNHSGAQMRAIASESTPPASRPLTTVLQTGETPHGVSNEDAQFLREYLGNAFNPERISNMPAAQRDDLVFEARMRTAADQHGRHRHQHERPKTPPGFWRTDMPTTQELEQDREEARRLERQKVEERWREAMREGGLWLFRDES